MKRRKTDLRGTNQSPLQMVVAKREPLLRRTRDRCEIWGTRCSRCNKVYVPPVKNCWGCFQPLDEWVPVSDSGVVESFTVARCPDAMFGLDPPVVYGLIRLGKASGSLLHYIGEARPEEVKVGMRVKAVFADRRSGNILDIKYFAPVRDV